MLFCLFDFHISSRTISVSCKQNVRLSKQTKFNVETLALFWNLSYLIGNIKINKALHYKDPIVDYWSKNRLYF